MDDRRSALWNDRADRSQHSLDHFFGTAPPQLLNNQHPDADNKVFNYWWLAHVMDCRIDAWERTQDPAWLAAAEAVSVNLFERNGRSPYNDYFDDMLWYALALLRLYHATGDDAHRQRAAELWDHVVEHGWNDTLGWSLAWRKQQLAYKNTPANGPLVILSVRLHRLTGKPGYLDVATTAFDWLTAHLVEESGFVQDGINRNDDMLIDLQWRFTYNQGLYIGAAVELADALGDPSLLERAERTAITALDELAEDGIFRSEGEGGDEGLFKGICYRYLGQLLPRLEPESATRIRIERFVRSSTDVLWQEAETDGWLLPGNDWLTRAELPVTYSTMLSAIMATELRHAIETGSV
jgi:predicted alpha-1,6-mannanase (GH76 family)